MELAIYEQSDEWDEIDRKFEGVTTMLISDFPDFPDLIVKSGIAFVGKYIVRGLANEFFGGNQSKPLSIHGRMRPPSEVRTLFLALSARAD